VTIDLYTICWNEEAMLGFFFRHYDPLVDRYVVYDDGSTDASLALLRGHPKVEVRRFDRVVPDSYVASAQSLHNSVWKESRGRADWVIVTAIDEHLKHADLAAYLARCKGAGVTLLPAVGYQMVTPGFPDPEETLARSRTIGVPFDKMNKLCIFDPDAIEETNYEPGRHAARPQGRVRYPERDEVLNLHYKYLGIDYLLDRSKLLRTGLGPLDRERKWGSRYDTPEVEVRQEFETLRAAAVDIADPRRDPANEGARKKWWRRR
jgi:hypothetical protein